jgi:hypothetical protein
MGKERDNGAFSHELGGRFTWSNPDSASQKGWELNPDIREKIADGTIKNFVIALNADTIQAADTLGGIEVIFNSRNTGFCIDTFSFPWYWDVETEKGGWIGYNDLLNENCSMLDSSVSPRIIYLTYDIKNHPVYDAFRSSMPSAEWAQLSIQYGLGIKNMPFINAYLR